jgi:hypothetical protein
LRVFEDRLLRKVFGSKREDINRKLDSKELYGLYSSPYFIKMIR